ncbi:two-component sensor histidine kinase/PAS domain-containing protein [Methylobacterium brachiatum]|jgi:two-component sensor histidine kinase/PAS domain-containing protein|uniref:Blue-light-activated histidine kinase n=1 Tax=Methylobacterium brachiatum TaxID=269660 RepID=A0AAJ1TKJ0_9HYPH|nr:HWE histidine kinase domain-containing protein [Methylobacterium brachiatum]MCB4802046.1 PAS domain-containing protein [Methylobacterium brachiatum]MDQ0542386.1 two-component sensor histidine kinase/PAS domain-containing protein [Methylobacterium brachiatum]
MDAGLVLPRADGTDRRLAALEAENLRLRDLLMQATKQADAERQRSRRLGRIIEAASRVESGRLGREPFPAPAPPPLHHPESGRVETWSAPSWAGALTAPGMLQVAADVLEILDCNGILITAGENGPAGLCGRNLADLIGRPWIDLWIRDEDREAVAASLAKARLGGASRFQAKLESGRTVTWWDIAVSPVGGRPGRPDRILAASRDITELKLTEARQTLLMQELSHRMKNTLAMVQAVAAQTLRNAGSLEAAGEALAARLLALAQAHDVLLQGSFAAASLVGLVEGAVSLHGDGVAGRFRVEGADVTLGPRHGMVLALMLHELGTNAAKYGALSVPTGQVVIAWAVTAAGEGATLRFRWEEVGGPPVSPPTRTGFGTRLIARSLAHSFGGTAQLSYPPTGAVLTFEAPLAAVTAG